MVDLENQHFIKSSNEIGKKIFFPKFTLPLERQGVAGLPLFTSYICPCRPNVTCFGQYRF
ncbi:hypothetical protein HanOQP8_Chr08g0275391 [Helianthus annuus]|nr:hypothetical protein HanOQP8_Chr08g0275391 [Helianthus annuus]